MQDEKIVCVSPNFVRIYTKQEEMYSKQVITAIYIYVGEKHGEDEASEPKYAIYADEKKKVIRVGECFYKDAFRKAVQIKVKHEDIYSKMENFLKRLMRDFSYFEVQINKLAREYDYVLERWPEVKENKIFDWD